MACAHEELPRDFVSGEAKGVPEERDPFSAGDLPVGVELFAEGPVGLSKCLKSPGVLDNRFDLFSVSDNPGIGQEPCLVWVAEGGKGVDLKGAEMQLGWKAHSCMSGG